MTCAELEERIASPVDRGALPDAALERHLAECAGCRTFARELQASVSLARQWHGTALDPAHYTALRARVMAQVWVARRPARRWLPLATSVALAALTVAVVLYRPAPVEAPAAPTGVEPARNVPPQPAPAARKPVVRRLPLPRRAPTARVKPLVVKLLTDDPGVVIYWIAEQPGD